MYCATKHALAAFTTATRHDLVGTAIRVTSISPGACEEGKRGRQEGKGSGWGARDWGECEEGATPEGAAGVKGRRQRRERGRRARGFK